METEVEVSYQNEFSTEKLRFEVSFGSDVISESHLSYKEI